MKKTKETDMIRFNPDGQCLQVAIDFLFSYFEETQSSQDIVKYSSDYKTIFEFLTKKGYNFVVSIPFFGVFFINFWILFLRFFKHFVFPQKYRNIKNHLLRENKKYIILGEDTAKRLYGLNGEYWSHFVVFYMDMKKNTLEIFDPLKSLLEKELGQSIKKNIEVDRLLLKLLIWKDA